MTSANLALVRSIYSAWQRGDWSSAEWADPEIEFVIADGPIQSRAQGIAELTQAWSDFMDAWEDWRVEPEAYRELDSARILVLVELGGRGKTSGMDVGQMRAKGANLFHLCEGKVTRLVIYWDRGRALADVGLRAESDSAR